MLLRSRLQKSEERRLDSFELNIAKGDCRTRSRADGFRPTIFEMELQPAGMLYTGVPGYCLPRELIRAVVVIQSLGVEIRCSTQVGKNVSFVDLRRDFAAVIIACGAKRSRVLPIPNGAPIGRLRQNCFPCKYIMQSSIDTLAVFCLILRPHCNSLSMISLW